jgi:murein DD-endopeptidase MepM/ murein hydrolase activator NlpD
MSLPGRARVRLAATVSSAVAAAAIASAAIAVAPASAQSGGAGMVSPASAKLTAPVVVPPVVQPLPGAPIDAVVATRKALGREVLRYRLRTRAATAVRIDVVSLADGTSVYAATKRRVLPGTVRSFAWTGATGTGTIAPDGRYGFRIALGAAATQAATSDPAALGGATPAAVSPPPAGVSAGSFSFKGAVFPVQGRHSYGGSGNRFGAGRSGHMHEGQDVLAACGTPVLAARGGLVIQRAFQGNAGNYVVIQDPATHSGMMYAHFPRPAIVRNGAHVATGQQIGVVGETGDATTCHLHFELWTAPGWYLGGKPIDPLATLRSWDHR